MEVALVVGLVGVVVEVQWYQVMEVLVDKDQEKEIVAEKEVDLVVVNQDQVQVCCCLDVDHEVDHPVPWGSSGASLLSSCGSSSGTSGG